ncbi:spindle assembly checkpoint component MAD1 [Coccidioides immitis H538.4]|uniref:Spindle assembly checkpoint component MAD1 n=1 Tax=Coccidioides immitis H538.4 TaxID=396776 RepID=A0A0J8RBX6_COCIT|nr:spindle assembly checkpoint component MAD1 [Coccidioides immitis H538.4]
MTRFPRGASVKLGSMFSFGLFYLSLHPQTIQSMIHPRYHPLEEYLYTVVTFTPATSAMIWDLESLQHEKELRELQARADADFRKAQAAESSSAKAQRKIESLAAELKQVQETSETERASCERKIRALQEESRALQEECDDSRSQLADQERQYKNQVRELETIRSSLQQTLDELRNELQETKACLQTTQERLSQREAEVDQLEAENIQLKSEGSEPEALTVLKRELSEQLSQVKRLESELRPLRKSQKKVEVVEEQKLALENKLHLMSGLEAELRNERIQNQVLQDERRSWTGLLQLDGHEPEFDSPEAVVRALVESRIENASLVDKIGNIQAQAAEKTEIINNLEMEKQRIHKEMESLRSNGAGVVAADSRAKTRLERQRVLAIKEVEYLRAQLKTFDAEETMVNPDENRIDTQKSEHIAQLEGLLSEHREELHKLHEELSKKEENATPSDSQALRGTKRPLSPAESDADSERLAGLVRKNRTLQDSLSKSEQSVELLRRELEAAKSHLSSLQAQSRTRTLELRSNPTADFENVKLSTLKTLRAENRDLLKQLRGANENIRMVPASTLDSLQLDLQEMEKQVADKEKRIRRLKEIWTAKSSEFREAVASILGYKLDFMPNGRVRVTSMFHLSPAYRHGDPDAAADSSGPGSMGDGEENSIIFDGENGTMKISGGPNSLFALEIRDLIKFWVEERKDIPCFLAAMTLEFYDKTTRAARM